jgi:hypothetical protein
LKKLVLCASVVCAVAACAEIFGLKNADYGDASATSDGGPDADADAVVDAGQDVVVFDQFTIDVNTALCDGAVTAVDAALWVSNHANSPADDSTCGTPTHPCATINYALAMRAADAGVKTIYVDDSTFYETLSIGAPYGGFTIQGGWQLTDAGWVPRCDSSLSKIYAPDAAATPSTTVWIHNIGDAGMTLRLLEIQSKPQATPGSGETLYAVMVNDTDVAIENVTLIAQGGAQGPSGSNGDSGLFCSITSSGDGAEGGVGSPGAAGAFNANGYQPGTAGGGFDGHRGGTTQGTAGQCGSCWTCAP